MTRLGINKDKDELIEKLVDALPHDIWGTFLMMLRNNRKEYKDLTLGEFIKHLEAQEMEQRKIARMKNYDGEQDIGLYFKSSVSEKTDFSPKVETAFNAKGSSEISSQGSSSKTGFTSFPTFDPHFSTTESGKVLQCNIALNLENDQNYNEEVAKSHMSLLVTVLESYGGLVAGRIGNPMLTKKDYDQIDAEEMELTDIKWCMASVLRRAEKEKGHFKRECTNREAIGAQNPFGNNDYYRKAIYHQVAQQPHQQQQPQTAHGRKEIEDSKRACLVNQDNGKGFSWDKYIPKDSKACVVDQEDEKLPEGFSWENYCPDKEFLAKGFKWKRYKEEEKAKAEKKKKANEEVQVRVVKEVPAFEIKTDDEVVKVAEKCMNCESLIIQNNELLHNIKRLKESYDVLNREMNKYNESSSEQAVAMNTLKGAYMRQLDNVIYYTEKCAELEMKLETQKIETKRVNELLKSYSCSTFVVYRIYPIVEGMKTFEEEKTLEEKKSETKEDNEVKISGEKPSVAYNRCPPPVENGYSPRNPNSERVKKATNLQWESGSSDNLPENIDVTFTSSDTDHESELIKKVADQVLEKDEIEESKSESKSESDTSKSTIKKDKRVYDKEFLLSKYNLNDEPVKVAYTLKDSDKLYSDEIFPIRSVKIEMIKKVFKITEINISEIKDLNLYEKRKQYTSRDQQRINKKMGYNYGYSFQMKPNHNGNFKKKGLGFNQPKNYKNEKVYKPKTVFVSGKSLEAEKEQAFRKQTNKEFLAKKQEEMKKSVAQKKIETRTCFQCKTDGHIARNCLKAFKPKQEVSEKLKEKIVEKTEPPTNRLKVFENSTFEVGECSKTVLKRKEKLNNQKWVVKKSRYRSGDESDSTKSEEPQVVVKEEKSVPPLNDENFPPLRADNLKSKIGKVEISSQFFPEKKEFDVEKVINPKVQNIFGMMIDGKVKGVKEFFEKKLIDKNPSIVDDGITPKAGQAWVSVFFA
ncbi:putative transcription factor interactor and regulator CCHC(Zn) family [Helianthus annuus]|nr:putative transcription factor interactor and regulator CCHC(Zn) family [Helianthus annuus]